MITLKRLTGKNEPHLKNLNATPRKSDGKLIGVFSTFVHIPNIKLKLLHMSLCQTEPMHNGSFPLHEEF